MAQRVPTPCTHPNCPKAATHKGRCDAHQRPAWQGSGRGRGRSGWDWQRTVRAILERDGPLCRLRIPGVCTGVATTADHVIALARGGSDDEANLVGACRECNQRKALTTDRGRG